MDGHIFHMGSILVIYIVNSHLIGLRSLNSCIFKMEGLFWESSRVHQLVRTFGKAMSYWDFGLRFFNKEIITRMKWIIFIQYARAHSLIHWPWPVGLCNYKCNHPNWRIGGTNGALSFVVSYHLLVLMLLLQHFWSCSMIYNTL